MSTYTFQAILAATLAEANRTATFADFGPVTINMIEGDYRPPQLVCLRAALVLLCVRNLSHGSVSKIANLMCRERTSVMHLFTKVVPRNRIIIMPFVTAVEERLALPMPFGRVETCEGVPFQ